MKSGARKIEVRFIEQTPLDICLDLWLRWHDRGDLCIGWSNKSGALTSESSASSEQLYDRMDNETAEAMDTMIGDLKVQYNWAIKKRCGIATMWKFPSLIFADVLFEAESELEKKMKINLATHNYFK